MIRSEKKDRMGDGACIDFKLPGNTRMCYLLTSSLAFMSLRQVGEKSVMYFKKNEEPPKMKKMKQIDMSEETVSGC